MTTLAPREIFKYGWRTELFLEKYKKGEPFDLLNGNTVSLVFSADVAKLIEEKKQKALSGDILTTSDNEKIKLSDLKKTAEFGGKGAGFGVVDEKKQIETLNQQITTIKLTTGASYVPIWIDRLYYVSMAEKTPGTPKSDIHLLGDDNKEVAWISHKKGKKASDFQQWSGMTEEGILDHPEVQAFAETVKQEFPDGIANKTTVARKITSNDLQMKSVYGIDYGSGYGQQNVSIVIQGDLTLTPNNEHWDITANHVMKNGEIPKGDYAPCLFAIYKGDRSNFGVKGARFAIQPFGSRKINKIL